MAGNAILSVVSMIGLALAAHGFITSYPTTTPTWTIGAMVGLFVWAFFVATSSLQIAFFEKRSLTAAAINLGYRLSDRWARGSSFHFGAKGFSA